MAGVRYRQAAGSRPRRGTWQLREQVTVTRELQPARAWLADRSGQGLSHSFRRVLDWRSGGRDSVPQWLVKGRTPLRFRDVMA